MMNVYIYNADVYCSDCGEQIIKTLNPSQDTGDSDDYPQGPTDQGESDCPEHCGSCGVFLENSMTDEGYRYLREMLSDAPVNEDQAALHATWIAFYGDPRSDIEALEHRLADAESDANKLDVWWHNQYAKQRRGER